MSTTPETVESTAEAYCVREDCHSVATHLVTQMNAETDQVIQVLAVCRFHAPVFLLGAREGVRTCFQDIDLAADREVLARMDAHDIWRRDFDASHEAGAAERVVRRLSS